MSGGILYKKKKLNQANFAVEFWSSEEDISF